MAIPLWIAFLIFVPGFLDEGGLLLVLLIMAIVKSGDSGYSGYSYSGTGYSGGSSYVLNKKTGVIHDRWNSSVDTISEHHRRDISYSEAQEVVNRGTRYRFKQDP